MNADTADLRELARLAGGNPRNFYVGTSLDGGDISGQDLRGMRFTGWRHSNIKKDNLTVVDPGLVDDLEDQEASEALPLSGSKIDREDLDIIADTRAIGIVSALRSQSIEDEIAWLERENPDDDLWPSIWQSLWNSTETTPEEQKILFKLGVTNLGIEKSRFPVWLGVWRKLAKHAKGLSIADRTLFIVNTSSWLQGLSPSFPYWAACWRKTWRLVRTRPSPQRLAVERQGTDWLGATNFDHAGWASVWRELWDDKSGRDSEFNLIEYAFGWLLKADMSHRGWASVYARIILALDHSRSVDLTARALQWIDENRDDYTWPVVWLRTNEAMPVERGGSLFRDGYNWLPEHEDHEAWPLVWQTLYQTEGDPRQHHELSQIGLSWLNRKLSNRGWHRAWSTLLASSDSDVQDLTELAFHWLRSETNSKGWPYVWLALFQRSDSYSQEDLLDQALVWIGKNVRHQLWPMVWQEVAGSAGHNLWEDLSQQAFRWLDTTRPNKVWLDVWLQLHKIESGANQQGRLAAATSHWVSSNKRDTFSRELLQRLADELNMVGLLPSSTSTEFP